MKRHLINLASLSLGWAAIVCNALGWSSSRYGWEAAGPPIVASEDGKVVRLTAVDVREPYDTPFVTRWHHLLVQSCSKKEQSNSLPCWPKNRFAISQSTLHRLAADDMPDYRRADLLLKSGSEAAPRVGVFGRWIVGTRPLAIAFFDDPAASAETYKRRAGGSVVASSQPSARRAKHDGAAFVSSEDLNETVTVIMLFSGPADAPEPSRVFTLRSPMSLRQVSELRCDPVMLERSCDGVATLGTVKE